METTRFTGRGELIPRLIEQVGGDRAFALKMMKKNGFLNLDGTVNDKFHERNNMSAGARAHDRAGTTPHPPPYDVTTNTVKKN